MRSLRESGHIEILRLGGLLASGTILFAAIGAANGQTTKPKPVAPRKTAVVYSFEKHVAPGITEYCIPCHGAKDPVAGVSLNRFKTAAQVSDSREIWSKVLKNIETGHMPPKGMPKPSATQRAAMVAGLKQILVGDCDLADVGRVTIRRLNRAEYNNTVRDLVGIEFRPADDFPSDDVGYGFDNIGDVLSLSPLLMEKYLNAAEQIADRAIQVPPKGTNKLIGPSLNPTGAVTIDDDSADFFSNGSVTGKFDLPRTGLYRIRVSGYASQAGPDPAKMEVLWNGERVDTFEVRAVPPNITDYEAPIKGAKGPGVVTVKFLNDYYDANAPEGKKDRNLYVKSVEVIGPQGGSTPPASHLKLIPKPPVAGKERETAREILSKFATRAYRRPVTPAETDRLVSIFDLAGKMKEPFERGIQLGMTAVLVSPNFLYRVETDRREKAVRNLNGYEIASRLSYFIWSSLPDERLMTLAGQGKLSDPAAIKAEALRMLQDPRAQALADNFAEQWLQLRKLDNFHPNPDQFPTFNDNLRESMRTETKMFFLGVMRNDRSVLDFLDGKYTYINEALAKHYGIPNVTGPEFRKVPLVGDQRGGVLSQASVLSITSNPTRTSPVKRGKWVLENILGTPPPPPPPGVGDLGDDKKILTSKNIRERMEQHRSKPDCKSCHSKMDPIGFGMENYDAVGRWRTNDDGSKIDSSGVLPDGRKFEGPSQLKQILLQNKGQFVNALSDRFLTYALGRGLDVSDQCFVEEVARRTAANEYKFSAFVSAVVTSEPFRKRKVGP